MEVVRAEVIGSLLRPAWLKEARTALQDGRLSPAEFKWIEDRAIDEAIAQQEAAGVGVITDGELRRSSFLGPLIDAVEGYGPINERIGAQSQWKTEKGESESRPGWSRS